MSKILFLLIFSPTRETIRVCCLSLRKAVQIFSIVTVFLFILYTLYHFLSSNIESLVIYAILSILLFISTIYIINSSFDFNFKKAYIGYVMLCLIMIANWCIIFINSCMMAFGIIFFHFMNFSDLLLFLSLSLWELYYIWITYNYTHHLQKGNDALIDGQDFCRYVENFASSVDNSINSSISIENRNINMRL